MRYQLGAEELIELGAIRRAHVSVRAPFFSNRPRMGAMNLMGQLEIPKADEVKGFIKDYWPAMAIGAGILYLALK